MLLYRFSRFFANDSALLPYSLLGLVIGLLSALAVIGFEWQITTLTSLWSDGDSAQDFESLPHWAHMALPVGSALALGCLYAALAPANRETGIVHVLSRMESHYGVLPLRNAALQFVAGGIALGSGQSGGREGPGVHLGAAAGSGLAQWLRLPNSSQRIVIACGTAGGIAAAFNMPIAGVVFAMEVIVAEYTVVGFTPVIVAAVSATTASHIFGGGLIEFDVPRVALASMGDLPLILLLGLLSGTLAAAFMRLLKLSLKLSSLGVIWRFLAAGALTGCIGVALPEVLGLGYDSLNAALLGELAPTLLAALLIAKLVTAAVSVGMGMPIGIIGPSLIIGGCAGSLLGSAATAVFPDAGFEPLLYAVIGMGAVMAAMLNAPLAALLAVIELTGNAAVVFPAMLGIISAHLTIATGWRSRSVHQTILQHLQRIIPEDPISQMLHRTNVASAMDRSFCVMSNEVIQDDTVSEDLPNWCLLKREEEYLFLARGSDLFALTREMEPGARLDLLEQDLRRWTFTRVSPRASLREAIDSLRRESVEAVLVTDPREPGDAGIRGVLTRDIIDQYYLRRL